jgi:hypothetical protein
LHHVGIYNLTRGLHLLFAAGSIPVALWSVMPLLRGAGSAALWGAGAFAFLWVLLFLGLDQTTYPAELPGALALTGAILLDVALSTWHGSGAVVYGIYVGALASMIAVTVVLGWAALRSLFDREHRAKFSWVFLLFLYGFVAGCVLLGAWISWLISAPMLARVSGSEPWVAGLVILGMASQIGAEMNQMHRASFDSEWLQSEDYARRQAAFENWGGLTALALVTSILAVIFVLLSPASG